MRFTHMALLGAGVIMAASLAVADEQKPPDMQVMMEKFEKGRQLGSDSIFPKVESDPIYPF